MLTRSIVGRNPFKNNLATGDVLNKVVAWSTNRGVPITAAIESKED